MLMISSLSIAFIKEAMIETHPVYLPSSPPAAIHHIYRHDNAISLTINYTGDETTLSYILDALTKPAIPVTLFLPVTLLNQHILTTDAALDSEQIDDLIEWGGIINRKKETTFIEVPTNIHFFKATLRHDKTTKGNRRRRTHYHWRLTHTHRATPTIQRPTKTNIKPKYSPR